MMDYQAQRRYQRTQRRPYRQQTRGYYVLIWLVVIASLAITHLWQFSMLAFFGLPFFFLVLRSVLFSTANAMKQQQYSQPQYEHPIYYQPSQQGQPDYQPYTEGYGAQQPPAQQSEIYQEGEQQYPAQQYEEPIIMYPEE